MSGYVNKAGSQSQVLSSDDMPFIETIDPQAFIDALNTVHPIDFYAEHDSDKLLATTVNHSLALRADKQGLHMEATIIDTNIGRDTYQMIKAGVISSMSFGFVVLDDDWDYNQDIPFRTVRSLELYEVSAVRFPAYLDSTIATRGKQELQKLESRGYTSVSNTVTIKDKEKGGNELDLRDFSTKDLFDEIQKRFAKSDNKPIDKEEARADTEPTKTPKVEAQPTLDGDTLAQQISDAILGKISDLIGVKETVRDDEPVDDTSADSGADESVPDDTETDSADNKLKEKEEARDDDSNEPDDSEDTSDADTTDDSSADDSNEPEDTETDSADKPKSSEKRSLLKEMEDIFKDED